MDIRTLRYADNFIYLLREGQRAAVVDPGAAQPVAAALQAEGCALELALITHHHADHTGGVAELKERSACRVVGPPGGLTAVVSPVGGGDVVSFAGRSIEVLPVPGHTVHDLAYYLPEARVVFTGDTLFAGGCGRVLGGQPQVMWDSLCRLRALPEDTRVFGGHDYTEENLEFAAFVDPQNAAVQNRLDSLRRRAAQGRPFEASTIAEEKQTNPFFRCRDAADFARLRSRKDAW
jgi:hydroxyacylglutathione hydrolase